MTEANTPFEVGEIVQMKPGFRDDGVFDYCMITVTEPKGFGGQGFVQDATAEGQAYIRFRFDQVERTGGRAVYVVGQS